MTHLGECKGEVWTITGSHKYDICHADEYSVATAWSEDGHYAYLACARIDETDILRRFDTVTKKVTDLTGNKLFPFKADFLAPSPDQSRILFRWGDSFVWNTEAYGYWIIDLNKITK
jgi:hypothetical protein